MKQNLNFNRQREERIQYEFRLKASGLSTAVENGVVNSGYMSDLLNKAFTSLKSDFNSGNLSKDSYLECLLVVRNCMEKIEGYENLARELDIQAIQAEIEKYLN